jgi:hypothetical protein
LAYRYGDIYSPRIEDFEPLRKICEHFLCCVQERKVPHTDGYNGLRVVSILEAASKSLKVSGKAVPVQLPKAHSKKSKSEVAGLRAMNGWR